MGMVAAARLLNRTLVLPPLVENRWMANHEFDRYLVHLSCAGASLVIA